jgi:hypothetical protein
MTPDERRGYYNACDPATPVEPTDKRHVNVDDYQQADRSVRGGDWVSDLAADFRYSDKPLCKLFTGLTGSGKSTLLRQLAAELRESSAGDSERFFTVVVDAERWIDPAAPVDEPSLQLAILYEVERALLQAEGKNPEDAAKEGYSQRLWSWLHSEVHIKGGELGATAEASAFGLSKLAVNAKSVVELRTDPTLREMVRERVKESLSTFLSKVWHAHADFFERAKLLKYHGVVVIVDSLEKLRGISSNFEQVLGSAERIFANDAPYLALADRGLELAPRVHVLYTVPPALALRRALRELTFLPMIKLYARSGAPFDPGFRAAMELITRRVPTQALDEIFTPEHRDARCRRIIEWSGGFPRDIIRLLRDCVRQRVLVTEPVLEQIIGEASDAYQRTLTEASIDWLASVAITKDLVISDNDKLREFADRALSDNLVLRYKNDTEWFDLHPAIQKHPRILAAIEKQRTANQS